MQEKKRDYFIDSYSDKVNPRIETEMNDLKFVVSEDHVFDHRDDSIILTFFKKN